MRVDEFEKLVRFAHLEHWVLALLTFSFALLTSFCALVLAVPY